ncbi:family 78 glycoside hydrolase catalytic domain [Niallia sp. JL1B1071]|uniref:alpha-L-rhamnosidase n=1 Tax=Niallia tiangongensis TaxID=3237105 RepID=UPI0037DC2565
MIISSLKTNSITNPLGFYLKYISFSWITEQGTSTSTKQVAAKVEVSKTIDFRKLIFDSGKSDEISSLAYTPDFVPEPRTRYFWRVTVWGDKGEEVVSDVAWFETGKMDEPWRGNWITPNIEKECHPIIRKSFELSKEVTSARIYISGVGLYHFEINGTRVGKELFTPGYNAYEFWMQYQTYDITNLLTNGSNAIGVSLGNGWYKGRFGFDGGYHELYGEKFALIAEMIITYADGSSMVIGTDESWKSYISPIEFSGIYDGEIYNANKEIENWSQPYFNDDNWYDVSITEINTEKLQERLSLPVLIKEERKPIDIIHTPAGETVLDFGQNMTGWVRLNVKIPKGEKIILQYGEILQDNCFYRENLRTAKAEYAFISDGTEREIQPHFTFFGFRYVKLIGFSNEIKIGDFTACVIYSDLQETGTIETSNNDVNQLFQNALWGQKGNFLDVPTDCPQRDERMGWTGDAQIFASTACYNMTSSAFYQKFMYDLREEQIRIGGSVPFIVPTIKPENDPGFVTGHGSSAWGDAATIIPWTLYLHYGDKQLLIEQFPIMKDWVDYIRKIDDKSGSKRLWKEGFHFGDWLALDGKDPQGMMGGTDPYYIATAYYYYSTRLVAKVANIIEETELSDEYHALADEIKAAINREYFTQNGRSAINTQTALIVALSMDLVAENKRLRIVEDLKMKLLEDGLHLNTGFVGTPYLCDVLSKNGLNDFAYTLLLNDDFPSWLYAVKMGATTIWERWNSVLPDGSISGTGMNSLNHYAYGSIIEWMYRHMCGINPTEDAPGFKKIRFEPKPNGQLKYAKATLQSASGFIESGWEIKSSNSMTFRFRVPFNTSAEVLLPYANRKIIMLDGKKLIDCSIYSKQEGDNVICELTPGYYVFEYISTREYTLLLTTSSSIKDFLGTNETRDILYQVFPNLTDNPFVLQHIEKPLYELAQVPIVSMFVTEDKLEELKKRLELTAIVK